MKIEQPRKTTIEHFETLDQELGMTIYFASELNQVTKSFKFRAAWNVVTNIDAEGFIAASSGNFGQALACACQMLQRKCIIVMPENSVQVKIDAIRGYGATIVFVDTKNISRAQRVEELAEEYPLYHVASAYDCTFVIAGNSSLGKEIAELPYDFDLIIAPVGGGGLTAGIIEGLRDHHNHTPVWAAEPTIADDLYRSLQSGERYVFQQEPQSLADGARTLSVGQKNWSILKNHLAGVIRVSEENIQKAMQILWNNGRKAEPTGALTLGALLAQSSWKGKKILAVISGGNVDQDLFLRIVSSKDSDFCSL